MKKCTKCSIEKPFNEFHIQKTGKDGLNSKCKECKNSYAKIYDKANYESKKLYKLQNKERLSKKQKITDQNFLKRNPNYHKEY